MTHCSVCGSCTPRTARTGPTSPRHGTALLCPSTDDHLTEVPEHRLRGRGVREPVPGAGAAPQTAEPGAGRPPRPSHWRPGPACSPKAPAPGAARWSATPPTTTAAFHELSPDRIDLVLEALIDRTVELGASPESSRSFVLRTGAARSGSPNRTRMAKSTPTRLSPRGPNGSWHSVDAYRRRYRRNLFDDVLAAERADGSRVVSAPRIGPLSCPHAARWPYELHCYPNRRVARPGRPGRP